MLSWGCLEKKLMGINFFLSSTTCTMGNHKINLSTCTCTCNGLGFSVLSLSLSRLLLPLRLA